MSDSLRDQLMKAGFKPEKPSSESTDNKKSGRTRRKTGPGKDSRSKNTRNKDGKNPTGRGTPRLRKSEGADHRQSHATKHENTEHSAAIAAEKKALKERIKLLIETHKIKEHSGSVAYSYQVGNRVKQLFVTEACRDQLAKEELVITRLNGSTFLIPPDIGQQILAINPDWALHIPGAAGSVSEDADYADHKIPDDLIW